MAGFVDDPGGWPYSNYLEWSGLTLYRRQNISPPEILVPSGYNRIDRPLRFQRPDRM
jgi:hypothetical protein